MNRERLINVLAIYEHKFELLKVLPERRPNGDINQPHEERLSHVAWMVEEAKKLANQGKIEKANRWLGFIQGFLWAKKFFTIEELKDHNRPAGY